MFRVRQAVEIARIPTKDWAIRRLREFVTPIPKTDAVFLYSKFCLPISAFTIVRIA
jgi:hypothetical protein